MHYLNLYGGWNVPPHQVKNVNKKQISFQETFDMFPENITPIAFFILE